MSAAVRNARVAPSRFERLCYLAQRQDCEPYAAPIGRAWWAVLHDGARRAQPPRFFLAIRVSGSEAAHLRPPPYGGLPAARAALAGLDARVPFALRCRVGALLGWLDDVPFEAARVVVAGADIEASVLAALLRASPGDACNPGAANVWLHTCERPDLAERAGEAPLFLHLRAEGWCALLRAVAPVGGVAAFLGLAAVAPREAVTPC